MDSSDGTCRLSQDQDASGNITTVAPSGPNASILTSPLGHSTAYGVVPGPTRSLTETVTKSQLPYDLGGARDRRLQCHGAARWRDHLDARGHRSPLWNPGPASEWLARSPARPLRMARLLSLATIRTVTLPPLRRPAVQPMPSPTPLPVWSRRLSLPRLAPPRSRRPTATATTAPCQLLKPRVGRSPGA